MRIVYELDRSVDVTLLYQRYYLLGLEQTGSLAPRHAALRAGLRARGSHLLVRLPRTWIRRDSGHVGRYRTGDGLRFMIDARDSAWIDEELVASCDLYFKANASPDRAYPGQVRPIVNGNGILSARAIEGLRRLRGGKRRVELAAVLRLWGSDHEVRVFEELARLDCSKRLLAIFPSGYEAGRGRVHRERLERAGVPWTTRAWSARTLWPELAGARVVLARPGRHRCWPWRTLDLLCMGAAAVYDELPPPRWPVPLVDGEHVVSCGIAVPHDRGEAPEEEYAKLADTIGELLADPARQRAIRAAAAAYFDDFAAPAAVGRYVRGCLERGA